MKPERGKAGGGGAGGSRLALTFLSRGRMRFQPPGSSEVAPAWHGQLLDCCHPCSHRALRRSWAAAALFSCVFLWVFPIPKPDAIGSLHCVKQEFICWWLPASLRGWRSRELSFPHIRAAFVHPAGVSHLSLLSLALFPLSRAHREGSAGGISSRAGIPGILWAGMLSWPRAGHQCPLLAPDTARNYFSWLLFCAQREKNSIFRWFSPQAHPLEFPEL